ncbi:hypothetical protein AB833_31410 [Chromatiales bacterium (ex Bugula neritina AB1)]|nr:hypothetical protein AB833_31410 [Chromatiales bacterium (ex Bugula neritina AB1)]
MQEITKVREDQIIEEIRDFRARYAKQFDNDLSKICEDLKKREKSSKKKTVSLEPKYLGAKKYGS